MHYLSKACLAWLFANTCCFVLWANAQARSNGNAPEPVRVIFVAGFNSGQLLCFRVDSQTGDLTKIPQCSKDFARDLPGEGIFDLLFQHNHLYLVAAMGDQTLEYDLNPDTLVLSNPRLFKHGVDSFAGYLFDHVAYIPSLSESQTYQFSVDEKDGSFKPLSPPVYEPSRKIVGASCMAQNPFNKDLFYLGGFYSGTIELLRRFPDGTLHSTGVVTDMPRQARTRFFGIHKDVLYATNQTNSTVFQFRIDHESGHLTPLDPPSISTLGAYTVRTVINGDNAYAVNQYSGNITSFTIKSDGTLAYKNPALTDIGIMPFKIVIDNQTHRLYASSERSPFISAVHINQDGTLDPDVVRFPTDEIPDPRYFLEAEIQPTH